MAVPQASSKCKDAERKGTPHPGLSSTHPEWKGTGSCLHPLSLKLPCWLSSSMGPAASRSCSCDWTLPFTLDAQTAGTLHRVPGVPGVGHPYGKRQHQLTFLLDSLSPPHT